MARKPRTASSLTKAEKQKVHDAAQAANAPLPPGWAFDGMCFVDGFGSRSKLRPDIETLCAAFLEKENANVKAHNARVQKALG